jgi:hypothetical protein
LIVAFVCLIVLVAAWLLVPNGTPVEKPVAAKMSEIPAAS